MLSMIPRPVFLFPKFRLFSSCFSGTLVPIYQGVCSLATTSTALLHSQLLLSVLFTMVLSLAEALRDVVSHRFAAKLEPDHETLVIDGIDLKENPQRVKDDPGYFWMRDDGSRQELVWVAKVIHSISGDRLDPYFNLPPQSRVSIGFSLAHNSLIIDIVDNSFQVSAVTPDVEEMEDPDGQPFAQEVLDNSKATALSLLRFQATGDLRLKACTFAGNGESAILR